MANIGDGIVLPGSYSRKEIISSGYSATSSNRILCIVGEGARREVIVNFASGNGRDGWNSTFTSQTSGMVGRYFRLANYPVVQNRTKLYKNGVQLVLKEEAISSTPINAQYDARLEITTGKIELQSAHILDQGGSYYISSSSNSGDGYINSLTLIDDSAQTETWTIKCTSVRKDIYGMPIDGYARFVASGSSSGVLLDRNGSPTIWQSDGYTRDNGILQFNITEGNTAFNVGDTFTVMVESGVLKAGDTLIAEYIAELDINDPEFFTDMDAVTNKHGIPSTDNTLSVGCQIAFANGTPGVLCCQAAPGIPRRTSYTVVETATGGSTVDDLKFILPAGVVPDSDSEIKFFIIDNVTETETQIVPNKVDFYNATYTSNPDSFITTASPYSYTVVMKTDVQKSGEDLTITPIAGSGPTYYAWVESTGQTFDLSDVAATITMHTFGATNSVNNGTFTVVSVSSGKLKISKTASAFVSETSIHWRLLNSAGSDSAYILLTQDLALSNTQGLRVGVIDTRDATFYDANWTAAYEKLESYDLNILVPLPTTTKSAIIQSGLQHCLQMSRTKNRRERVLFTGALQGLLPNNITGVEPAAVEDIGVLEGIQGDDATEILAGNTEDLTNYSVIDSFGSTYRCVYMYPDKIVVSISGTATFFDGMYLAAASGGYLSGVGNVAIPLTNKTLAGFSILRDRTYNNSDTENLVKSGVCLVEPVQGGGRVVWGITTSQSGFVEDQEISIVFIGDIVAYQARQACQGFVGQPASATVNLSIGARVGALLRSLVSQGLITDFTNPIVKRDSVDPTQYNVSFSVEPTYGINFIDIKFSVGTLS